MLIRFKVSNHLSFGLEQDLSMVSGGSTDHIDHIRGVGGLDVLSISSIHGSHGSGKTNLVASMSAARDFIVHDVPIPDRVSFRNLEGSDLLPTVFEFQFDVDGSVYSYGFGFVTGLQMVESEWLHLIDRYGVRESVFTRIGDSLPPVEGAHECGRIREVLDSMDHDGPHLLLNRLSASCDDLGDSSAIIRGVMSWFSDHLCILKETDLCSGANAVDPFNDIVLMDLLSTCGSDMTEFGFDTIDPSDPLYERVCREHFSAGLNPCCASLMVDDDLFHIDDDHHGGLVVSHPWFRHEGSDTVLRLYEESDATRKLLSLLSMLMLGPGDLTYIIDGMEDGIDPSIAHRLLGLFSENIGYTHNQLVFTSHEDSVLDLDHLRSDEVWVVEKGADGTSLLHPMVTVHGTIGDSDIAGLLGGCGPVTTMGPII